MAAIGRWARWVPAIVAAGAIFLASSSTTGRLSAWHFDLQRSPDLFDARPFSPALFARNWEHLPAFGLLTLTVLWALGPLPARRRYPLAAALVALYAALDELHQAFVPVRTPQLIDLEADLLGMAAAMCLWGLTDGLIQGARWVAAKRRARRARP